GVGNCEYRTLRANEVQQPVEDGRYIAVNTGDRGWAGTVEDLADQIEVAHSDGQGTVVDYHPAAGFHDKCAASYIDRHITITSRFDGLAVFEKQVVAGYAQIDGAVAEDAETIAFDNGDD